MGILTKKGRLNSLKNNFLGRFNQERFEGIKKTGIKAKKIWLTCGSDDVRPYHLAYERLGWVDVDYEYAPGLKFPGDPCCNVGGQIDGCRCSVIWDTEPSRAGLQKTVIGKTEVLFVCNDEVIK